MRSLLTSPATAGASRKRPFRRRMGLWGGDGSLGSSHDEAASLSPPRRDSGGLSGDGDGKASDAPSLGAPLSQGVGAIGRAAGQPLQGRPARPAPARGLRGRSPPPLHPRLARPGDGRLRRGRARAETVDRRPRHGGGDRSPRRPDRPASPAPARADVKPAARPPRTPVGALRRTGGL